jgi:hypothetical protein
VLWTAALTQPVDAVMDAVREVVTIARVRTASAKVALEVADIRSWTTDVRLDLVFRASRHMASVGWVCRIFWTWAPR